MTSPPKRSRAWRALTLKLKSPIMKAARNPATSLLPSQVFGRLTLVREAPKRLLEHNWRRTWVCRCSCGSETTVEQYKIISGHTVSCGCWKLERSRTHAMTGTPEHRCWKNMRSRCTNPNIPSFDKYGGRGIQICARWSRFENFFEDMGPRPTPKHTIERIDNNGHYCPENCKWATMAEQDVNKRTNRFLAWDGKTLTVSQWACQLGMPETTLRARIGYLGWSIEKALTLPRRPRMVRRLPK